MKIITLKTEPLANFDIMLKEAKAMAISEDATVKFDFNGIENVVNGRTNIDALKREYMDASIMEWKTVGPDCETRYDADTKIELYTRMLTNAKREKEINEAENGRHHVNDISWQWRTYIRGSVTDAVTGLPINYVDTEEIAHSVSKGYSEHDGIYVMDLTSYYKRYVIKFSKEGYNDVIIELLGTRPWGFVFSKPGRIFISPGTDNIINVKMTPIKL